MVLRVRFPSCSMQCTVHATTREHLANAGRLRRNAIHRLSMLLPMQMGTWCSGITSASHAEGPGFKSQCVHFAVVLCNKLRCHRNKSSTRHRRFSNVENLAMTGNLQWFKLGGQTITRATLSETTKNGMPPKEMDMGGRKTNGKRPDIRTSAIPQETGKTPTVGLEPTTTRLRALRSAD